MARFLPANWGQAFADLREDIQRALERWLPRRRAARSEGESLPVKWREAVGQLQEDIHDTLARWLPRWRGTPDADEEWLPSVFTGAGPLIEVEERKDEVVVWAELPGLERDDFSVEVARNRVIIRGEKKRAAEEQREGYYYAERSYGTFARVIPLPCEVETDNARARYRNGVLRITLPKTEQAKATRVRIHVT